MCVITKPRTTRRPRPHQGCWAIGKKKYYYILSVVNLVQVYTVPALSFYVGLSPFLSLHFPTCLLLCIKILLNVLIIWSYYSWLFSCMLFLQLRVTIYALIAFLAMYVPHYILVTYEPHFYLRYAGGISLRMNGYWWNLVLQLRKQIVILVQRTWTRGWWWMVTPGWGGGAFSGGIVCILIRHFLSLKRYDTMSCETVLWCTLG
jgi:hypothetical protein